MEKKLISFCRLQVVLLHGQAFTSKTWEELGTMALLAVNGYQALAMDLPGKHITFIITTLLVTVTIFKCAVHICFYHDSCNRVKKK